MACHSNPEFFDKLIFINPQSLYSQNQIPSNQTRLLKLIFETPIIGTFIYNILNTKHSFEKTFANEYFYDPSKIKEKYILNYMEAAQKFGYSSKYSFISYTGKFMNTNIIHSLKEINNSILMIGSAKKKILKQH